MGLRTWFPDGNEYLKNKKKLNLGILFTFLTSYSLIYTLFLHCIFISIWNLKKKKKKSATSSKQKCGVYFRHVFGFKIHAEDLCLIR